MPTETNGVVGDGVKTVTTAGTAVKLNTTSTPCRQVLVTALSGNTGNICVGASTVVAASGTTRRGTPLLAGESVTFNVSDLSLLYIDSTVNGEGVSYSYEAN